MIVHQTTFKALYELQIIVNLQYTLHENSKLYVETNLHLIHVNFLVKYFRDETPTNFGSFDSTHPFLSGIL